MRKSGFIIGDLDLDPVTLRSKLDLDIVLNNFNAKYEVNRSSDSKVTAWSIHQ